MNQWHLFRALEYPPFSQTGTDGSHVPWALHRIPLLPFMVKPNTQANTTVSL